jgi:hypothetical protein
MIMERGARPDAPRLALGVGLGIGLGANFAFVGALGPTYPLKPTGQVLSQRERFRLCSLTEAEADPVPTPADAGALASAQG